MRGYLNLLFDQNIYEYANEPLVQTLFQRHPELEKVILLETRYFLPDMPKIESVWIIFRDNSMVKMFPENPPSDPIEDMMQRIFRDPSAEP